MVGIEVKAATAKLKHHVGSGDEEASAESVSSSCRQGSFIALAQSKPGQQNSRECRQIAPQAQSNGSTDKDRDGL